MRLRVRPMGLHDVENCVALLASHPEERRRYGGLLEELPAAWKKLIRGRTLTSALLEDMDAQRQLVGLGVAVFVDDEFLRRLKSPPWVWMGPELTRRACGSSSDILSASQIREANSDDGVNIAVWAGIVSAADCEDRTFMRLYRAFVEGHVGYHIKELIAQPVDMKQIHGAIQGGVSLLSGEGHYVDGRPISERLLDTPFIVGGDRETVKRTYGSWFSGSLFPYTPPIIYFRPAEQRLLLAALSGLTDEELSNELGVSYSAIKKTWGAVYDRATRALPDEFLDKAYDKPVTKRGKQKKQRLLAYLRNHMEELRPVLPPRNRPGRPFISATNRSRMPLQAVWE